MQATILHRLMLLSSLLLVVYGSSPHAQDSSPSVVNNSSQSHNRHGNGHGNCNGHGHRHGNCDGETIGELGAASNTGIPGAPLASVTPFTASRPDLIDLDYLTDDNGVSIRQTSTGIISIPGSFQALGDVNGDGAADFKYSTSEQTIVVFGSNQRLQSSADSESFSNAQGFTMSGKMRFAGVGDVNGDGIDDIAMDTYDSGRNATGARIILGRRDGQLQRAIEAPVAGVDGFDIANSERLRDIREVQAAGDFNDDGIDDLLIASYAFNRDDYEAPNAWVVYGSSTPFASVLDVANLDASQGLALTSPLSANELAAADGGGGTGYSASVAGNFDLNGDGVDDVAIGTNRFDWTANSGESRTYVVYGSATPSAANLDMTSLDGSNGLRISAVHPNTPAPDSVTAVGDVDGNGYADLGLVDGYNSTYVFYAAQGLTDPVVDRANLPAGVATQVSDSSEDAPIAYLRAVGDLDGDSTNEVGIELSSGQAAIIYGGAGQRPAWVDLATPGEIDVTRLQGGGDELGTGDAYPLVSLGDINNDGLDDLGWGWSTRSFNGAIMEIDDINDDGVADLQIGKAASGRVALLRILYGFDADAGFTGVLASTEGPAPIATIEENFYNELFTAMDDAARISLELINSALSAGTDPGPPASACLAASEGVDTATVQQFSCSDAPLALAFEWGGDRYSGAGEARFSALNRPDAGLQEVNHTSYPVPDSPGISANPFQAHVSFDADTTLKLNSFNPDAGSCSIDPQTRQTVDDPATCSSLVGTTIYGLNGVFGPDSVALNLRINP